MRVTYAFLLLWGGLSCINVSIDTLPGGEDPFIVEAGGSLPETFVNDYGETQTHTLHAQS